MRRLGGAGVAGPKRTTVTIDPGLLEVLRNHTPATAQGNLWCSGCDWEDERGVEWADHLALAVQDYLGARRP